MPADAAGIARVDVETWRATYRGIVPDQLLADLSFESRLTYSAQIVDQAGQGGRCVLVAEDDSGSVVGFVSAGPSRWPDLGYTGEVYGIYVSPSAQRGGVGRSLMAAAAQHLLHAGMASLMLWVLTANPYRRFYDRLGGTVFTERQIKVRGYLLDAAAYGWSDTQSLVSEKLIPRHRM